MIIRNLLEGKEFSQGNSTDGKTGCFAVVPGREKNPQAGEQEEEPSLPHTEMVLIMGQGLFLIPLLLCSLVPMSYLSNSFLSDHFGKLYR